LPNTRFLSYITVSDSV